MEPCLERASTTKPAMRSRNILHLFNKSAAVVIAQHSLVHAPPFAATL